MKKIFLIIGINIILGIGQFWLLSLISTDGEEVWREMQAQKTILSQNQALKLQIFTLSALPAVKLRAEKLNFVPLATDFWRTAVVARSRP